MDANPYYDPEKSGLVKVGELDEAELSYEYNTLVVWRHEPSGRVFYARDSGCSCPTPFEDYTFSGPDDTNLTPITIGDSFASFTREVEDFPATQDEREGLIQSVRQLMPRGEA